MPPLEFGSQKQLFIDDVVIDEAVGVRRNLNQPAKYVGNPVMIPLYPWEGRLELFGTVRRDPDGSFRMWYQGMGGMGVAWASHGFGLDGHPLGGPQLRPEEPPIQHLLRHVARRRPLGAAQPGIGRAQRHHRQQHRDLERGFRQRDRGHPRPGPEPALQVAVLRGSGLGGAGIAPHRPGRLGGLLA